MWAHETTLFPNHLDILISLQTRSQEAKNHINELKDERDELKDKLILTNEEWESKIRVIKRELADAVVQIDEDKVEMERMNRSFAKEMKTVVEENERQAEHVKKEHETDKYELIGEWTRTCNALKQVHPSWCLI